jgi:hypothetical protein
MAAKNDISEELRSLSALVATISRETPYQAPTGYFTNFPDLVLEKTASALTNSAKLLTNSSKPLTFSVPDGYFEGFAQQMLARIKSIPDLKSIPRLTSIPDLKSTPGLSHGALEQEELPAILSQAARLNPYTVPDGYFDGLSPILAILKDKNPYAVPAGYFDRLADQVNARTLKPVARLIAESNGQAKAKVIGLGKRMSWLKYSAAAVVAGLIVTVGWLRWPTAKAFFGASRSSASIAAVTQPAQTPLEIAKNLFKVSDAELQNFLVDQDTTLAQPVTNNALMATVDMDDSNLKTLLGDVPDGELKQYLDEHGGANDIATN